MAAWAGLHGIEGIPVLTELLGSQVEFGTYVGGRDIDTAIGVALGPPPGGGAGDRVYVTGRTDSFDFPRVNELQRRYGSNSDAFVTVVAAVLWTVFQVPEPHEWTPEEIATLESLWIGGLPPVPPDPSNAVADDPRAAELGHRLFFDTRLSVNGEFSCATCHQPEKMFTDGRPLSEATGTTKRHAPSVVGAG